MALEVNEGLPLRWEKADDGSSRFGFKGQYPAHRRPNDKPK
jgi:hypothetical protein